jgi:hypothetical protein
MDEHKQLIDDILSVYKNNFKNDDIRRPRLINWLYDLYTKDYIKINDYDKQKIINRLLL